MMEIKLVNNTINIYHATFRACYIKTFFAYNTLCKKTITEKKFTKPQQMLPTYSQ